MRLRICARTALALCLRESVRIRIRCGPKTEIAFDFFAPRRIDPNNAARERTSSATDVFTAPQTERKFRWTEKNISWPVLEQNKANVACSYNYSYQNPRCQSSSKSQAVQSIYKKTQNVAETLIKSRQCTSIVMQIF